MADRLAHLRDVPLGAWLVAGIVAATALSAPWLGGYHAYVASLVIIQVIAVLSLNLLMGYAGQVSLGQAAFVGMGAFGATQLATWGVPFPATVVAAVAITAGAAALVGLPSLRIRGLHLAVTTLAFGLAAELLLFARPWDDTASMGMSLSRPSMLSSDRDFLLLALASLVGVLLVDRSVRRSRIGRAFTAVRDREDIAPARGIPVGVTKLTAYAISGMYAGVAGSLYAYLLERVTAEPFSIWQSLEYVAAAVIGGLGSWSGAAIAGGAFTALPEVLRPVALYAPLTGALLLAVVPALRPEGLGWLLDRSMRRREVDVVALTTVPATGDTAAARDVAALTPPRRSLPLDLPLRTVLQLDDVHVSFGGLDVLTGVSVSVHRGAITGLIGPNGAGKSTLFNCVSGFVTPSAGSIHYLGRDLLTFSPHRRPSLGIARTFQHTGLVDRQTVLDNVLMAQHELARYHALAGIVRTPTARRTESELAERARAALGAVGLGAIADRPVAGIPHLQQRLVEIAGAIASGPRLLLLDEPAAGVRPEEAADLGARLRELRDRLDLTIVVIEHHVPMVADLCDDIFVLAEGRVLCHGDPETVQRDPQVQRVYLGESDEDPSADVMEVAGV